MRKTVSGIMLTLLLVGILTLAFNIQPVKAEGTIYIRADGSIDPPTAPIQRDGNLYTFIDSIIDNSIAVERSNIVIDGFGYDLTTSLDITYGLVLSNVAKVTIENIGIRGFWRGISLYNSLNNIIAQNNVSDNSETGIELFHSPNNSLYANTIANNGQFGINFMWSPGNILRDNNFTGNKYNLWLSAGGSDELASFIQDIDESNTVDGKPTYYLINHANVEIPSNSGYIGLINCYNITIRGAELKHNSQGILLANTTNSKILNNIIRDNSMGIQVWKSSNNLFSQNIIEDNAYGVSIFESHNNGLFENNISSNLYSGIEIYGSSNNEVSMNNVTNNNEEFTWGGGGIYITMYSTHNIIYKNNIANNSANGVDIGVSSSNSIHLNSITHNGLYGVRVYGAGNIIYGNNITSNFAGIMLSDAPNTVNNRIFHNNFINNKYPSGSDSQLSNIWDNGYPSGGNYWSEYTYSDSLRGPNQDQPGSDGIGDVPIIINSNNVDSFPLMAPISIFDAGTWDSMTYNVNILSNSTVSDFYFNPEEGAFLRFNVTGENGTDGFCRVTIPNDLLWVEDGWTITVGDQPITNYTIIPDANHAYLYFTYNHSTQTVMIQGTHVIPEFPSTIILPLFMLTTLIATVLLKKKRKTKPQLP